MYGGVTEEDKHIEFYSKVSDLIDKTWERIQKMHVVSSFGTSRPLKLKNIDEPNKNKVFNYLIQLLETEKSLTTIHQVLPHFRSKRSKVILYTYDAILIDMHKSEADLIKTTKELLTNDGKFPVRAYIGKNYHEMKEI
jgi:hypothetical protein